MQAFVKKGVKKSQHFKLQDFQFKFHGYSGYMAVNKMTKVDPSLTLPLKWNWRVNVIYGHIEFLIHCEELTKDRN